MEDSRDYLIDILKEKYEYEFKRKQYYDDSLGMPVTILSLLIAGVYVVITDPKILQSDNWFLGAKWILVILMLIIFVLTFFFLFRVYFGFNRLYRSMPDSKDIVSVDYKALVDRHEKVLEDLREEYIISDLKEYSIKWYTDCNEENTQQNDRRGQYFYNSRILLGLSLIIGLLLLVLICVSNYNMSKRPSTPPPPPTPVRREKSDNPIVQPRPVKK